MKLITAAKTYAAFLPAADELHAHLINLPFEECQPIDYARGGFIYIPEALEFTEDGTPSLVSRLDGAYAFRYRYDEKIVPAAVVTSTANKRIADEESDFGFRLGKIRRREIREDTFRDLVLRALVRTKEVTCFYVPSATSVAPGRLIVATSSKSLADNITGALVKVMGSLKAQTIYVSTAKASLTTRLSAYLQSDFEASASAFDGRFHVGGEVRLKNSEGRTISIKAADLPSSKDAIGEAIAAGAQVEAIQLESEDCRFNLTANLDLKRIEMVNGASILPDFGSAQEHWYHEASIQTAAVSAVVSSLCAMFDYDPASAFAAEQDPLA